MSASAKRAKPDAGREKSSADRQAGRAAQRDINRLGAVDDGDEMSLLMEQLDAIDESSGDEASQECDIIRNRFQRLAQDANASAAHKANEALPFEYVLCLRIREMLTLRILAPSGHGFCCDCATKSVFTSDMGRFLPCPSCDQNVTAVITPYF